MKIRTIIRSIHLWLSLVVGVFICLLGISGSVLVFENEINRTLHSKMFTPSKGEALSVEELKQAVKTAYPEGKIHRIYTPDERSANGVYNFIMLNQDERMNVYVDPSTGTILGTKDSGTFLQFVTDFHHTFLIQSETIRGMDLVGYTGVALLIISISGIVLWWPKGKMKRFAFKKQQASHPYKKQYEWHRLIGIYSIPFLLLIAITGALFPFGEKIFTPLGLETRKGPTPEQLMIETEKETFLPFTQLTKAATKDYPEAIITQIRMPREEKQPIEFRLSYKYDPSQQSTGNVRVWVNPYEGTAIKVVDSTKDKSFASVYQTWLFPLHTGRFGGLFTQVLFFIGGFIPTILGVTGVIMWRLRTKKKASKQKQTPLAATFNV